MGAIAEMTPGTLPPEQPSTPPAFEWTLQDGAESWTSSAADIAAMSDPPIIEGLLREREVASVVGGAKSCKTWFSLRLALAVAMGEDFIGYNVRRRRVLYLDYELKEGTFRKRVCMLAGSKPTGFLYQLLRGKARLPTLKELSELVAREEIGLVVVDSLYRTQWLSEENCNDSTGKELTPIQRLANDTGASVLVIDHTAKGGGEGRNAVDASRGASAKGGFFDGIFVLRPTDQGPDPAGNYVILDPVVRDWPPFHELPLMSFSWTATSAEIEVAGNVEPNAANNDTTLILSALAECDQPTGNAHLAAVTELSAKRTREALAKLKAKGKVLDSQDPTHKQRRLWRLPDLADQP